MPSADANSVAVDQVSAEWNVPTLCLPDGGDPSKDYFMASWIGFMANGCEGVRGALLQAGVTNTVGPAIIITRGLGKVNKGASRNSSFTDNSTIIAKSRWDEQCSSVG